jgi:hypothetical protein
MTLKRMLHTLTSSDENDTCSPSRAMTLAALVVQSQFLSASAAGLHGAVQEVPPSSTNA